MLPEPYRMHRRTDFSATVRGRRSRRRLMVIHVNVPPVDVVRVGGPRFGLIVSKAVGPAVVRHRVARRLRHVSASMIPGMSAGTDIVIRALPGAAGATSAALAADLKSGLTKLGVLDPARSEQANSPGTGVGPAPARSPGRCARA